MVGRSTDRVLEKMRANLDRGAFYEAQQMLKTVYFRYRSRRLYQESYDVLEDGACLQLRQGQVTCGVELGRLLVDAYASDAVPADKAAVARLYRILDALPCDPGTATQQTYAEEATRMVLATLKWARKQGADVAAAELHDWLARYLWEGQGVAALAAASVHWAHGRDPEAFASALVEASRQGGPTEEDLFLARAVLQVLAAGTPKQRTARTAHVRRLLLAYENLRGGGMPDTPLAHYTGLVPKAVRCGELGLVRLLRRYYAAALARDPALGALADRLEGACFGVAQPGLGGMLGDMMQALLAGEDDGS
ncbi:hypothetical protein WJX81_007997 [Elliptochloris bilobata]|uniref:Uncharacterized protein n=1 Tax=Elliptochloris bilobata TaxID=381761 RepID=A0AAW1SM10_9CHLO